MVKKTKEEASRPKWPSRSNNAPNSRANTLKATNSTSSTSSSRSTSQSAPQNTNLQNTQHIPLELQQRLLNIFRDSFSAVITRTDLQSLLQNIKSALFARDFENAFGGKEWLEAYAVRWSPGRALGYADVLLGLKLDGWLPGFLNRMDWDRKRPGGNGDEDGEAVEVVKEGGVVRVVCFGGGAAEVGAFGGVVRCFSGPVNTLLEDQDDGDLDVSVEATKKMDLVLVDSADWGLVVRNLDEGFNNPPVLPKYASAASKFANAPLISKGTMQVTFHQKDVLEVEKEELRKLIGPGTTLITLFFTLNELYTSSIARTTVLLLNLTEFTAPGTRLLIIDSPGSYSEASIGKSEDKKRHPMHWLMDHTLLQEDDEVVKWKKEVDDQSRWFRLDEELRYPIQLENMRYQIHLYRRL